LKKTIAVFGSGRFDSHDPRYELSELVGRALAARQCRIINGGYGGAMEATAVGARNEAGKRKQPAQITGVLLGQDVTKSEPNEFLTATVNAGDMLQGLHEDYQVPACQWGLRIGTLLSADGAIAIANRVPELDGTLIEVLAFAHLSRRGLLDRTKRLAICDGPGRRNSVWSNWVLTLIGEKWQESEGRIQILGLPIIITNDPVEAVDWVSQ
jgi:hypothetical protein